MKEYMKMSDHFSGSIGFDADGDAFDNETFFGTIDAEGRDAIEHAVNSHDELVEGMNHYKGESERWEARAIKEASRCVELVEMNKELLKTLKNALEECEFEIRHGGQVCVDICAIRKAIEMAKGSAA